MGDSSDEETSKIDAVEHSSQTKQPRCSDKEAVFFETFSIGDKADQEFDSVGVRQISAKSAKLQKPDVWESLIALESDITTEDDLSRGCSIKAAGTSQTKQSTRKTLVSQQVKRRTSRGHASGRGLKRISPVILRRSTRKKVASTDDVSVVLTIPSPHLPSSPKL